MSRVFTAQSLGKSYRGVEVLKGATLWGERARISALLGRNGSGKTTLMECAFGLRWPDYGVVQVGGLTFERPAPHRMARLGVFYLPHRGLLSSAHSLRRHLEPVAGQAGAADLSELVGRLKISHVLDQKPHQVSGGERRRAELAIALLRRPTCLLADEPFAGVTPKDRIVVADALRELAEGGCAVVITGHDVNDVLALADDVTWMVAGTTHQLGTPEQARAHHQFVREYLGDAATA